MKLIKKLKNTEIYLHEGDTPLDKYYVFKKGDKTINVSDPEMSYSSVIHDVDDNGNLYNERPNPVSLEEYKNYIFLNIWEELENE